MADDATPQYEAYGRTGREGMGAKERQQKRAAAEFARTPEGRRDAELRQQIARLEARLQAAEQDVTALEGEVERLKARPEVPKCTAANQFIGSGANGLWQPIDSDQCP